MVLLVKLQNLAHWSALRFSEVPIELFLWQYFAGDITIQFEVDYCILSFAQSIFIVGEPFNNIHYKKKLKTYLFNTKAGKVSF